MVSSGYGPGLELARRLRVGQTRRHRAPDQSAGDGSRLHLASVVRHALDDWAPMRQRLFPTIKRGLGLLHTVRKMKNRGTGPVAPSGARQSLAALSGSNHIAVRTARAALCRVDTNILMTTFDEKSLIRIRDNPALWPEPETDAPDDETIEFWICDGVVEATDGCTVEPDGICPHGHPSWLLRIGII